ncbi:hypothetical protein [Arthrobacter sp. NPDC092385]|jgi:predicted HicB family RNase H-like nuclease|uniref:hypothetical protein n=1 Tax=Arthrobacter sp. NPDC092385 TaxID=3363943 RepID=UPI00382D2CE2
MSPSEPKKRGRPSKGDRQLFTVRVNTEDARKLVRLAKERKVPVNSLVAENIHEFLKQVDELTPSDQEALPMQRAS